MFHNLINIIDFVINIYILCVIVRAVLSWIPHNPYNTIIRFIYEITDPPLNWIRRWMPNLGGIDLSPMILIFGIIIIRNILF